ncbi:MAG TPA: DUF3575 domain-containing protein [Ferruginibacter sp.]|nr:DUF3575 domain-containing protein [Ferruginibacter sp.]
MKHILPFFFIFITLNGICQTNKVLVKISPLALVDEVGFPAIQAGVEFMLSKNVSLYSEFGVKYRKGYYEFFDTSFFPSNGFKVKTELRYYFRHTDNSTFYGKYIAANAFFIRDSHNTVIGYNYQRDTSMAKIDNFGVKRNIFGINILYGYQYSFSRSFSFDIFGGVGLRLRSIRTKNKDYDQNRDALSQTVDVTIASIRDNIDANNSTFGSPNNSGDRISPNVTLGFRLCYKL